MLTNKIYFRFALRYQCFPSSIVIFEGSLQFRSIQKRTETTNLQLRLIALVVRTSTLHISIAHVLE